MLPKGAHDTAFHKSYSWPVISLGEENSHPQRVIKAPFFLSKAYMSLTVKRRQHWWKETLLSWEIRSMKVRPPCKSLMCNCLRCKGWVFCLRTPQWNRDPETAEAGSLMEFHHFSFLSVSWMTFFFLKSSCPWEYTTAKSGSGYKTKPKTSGVQSGFQRSS